MTYSEWRDDTVPVKMLLAFRDTDNSVFRWTQTSTSYPSFDLDAAAMEAWTLTGMSAFAGGSGGVSEFGPIATGPDPEVDPPQIFWRLSFLTVTVPSATRTGTGTPLSDPFEDPNVVGIEWDPDPVAAYGYEAAVRLKTTQGPRMAGMELPVKIFSGVVGTRYEPVPQEQGEVMVRPTPGSIFVDETGTNTTPVEFPIGTAGTSLDGAFAVSVVDPWTASLSTTPFEPHNTTVSFGWEFEAWGWVRPRYRLIYADDADTTPPILRVHPRPDGRGLSSARRVWPPSKTAQDLRWHPLGGGYR